MEPGKKNRKSLLLKLLLVGLVILIIGGGTAWYMLTKGFGDTANTKADYTMNAMELIKEFKQDDAIANKKYAKKVITVLGKVSSIEPVDTSLNVKIEDSTGSYILFVFQQKDFSDVKKLKKGEEVSIRGSCSGGAYSEILETEFITFKRCSLNK